MLFENLPSKVLPTTASGYILFAVLLFLLYCSSVVIYNLYLHPLAGYPGSFMSCSSRLWYIQSTVRGRNPFDVHKLHVKYGNVVRIAPDELAYIDPAAWKDIYGLRVGKSEIPKDPRFYNTNPGAKDSIINADTQLHGEIRRLLAHGFSERALRDQVPIIQQYLDLFIRRLRDLSMTNEEVDIVKWYNFLTFDAIGDLAFAEPFDCLKTSKYHPWIDFMFDALIIITYGGCMNYYPALGKALQAFAPKSLLEGMEEHTKLMKSKALYRRNLKTDRLDLMTRMAAPDNGLSDEKFIASADTILLGGSETTSTLLSGTTYYLLQNPHTLERLTQEIRNKFNSEEEIDMAGVNSLEYMLACLNETFRLYPPVPSGLPRRTEDSDTIVGKFVPPDTTLSIYHWAMYHSSSHFSRSEEFIPERWLGLDPQFEDDNRSVVQPFSVGARNCIGRNLAYVEMRLTLARLLFNFDIEETPATKGWINQKVFILWHKPPLWIKLRPRGIKSRPEVTGMPGVDEVNQELEKTF